MQSHMASVIHMLGRVYGMSVYCVWTVWIDTHTPIMLFQFVYVENVPVGYLLIYTHAYLY